MIDCHRLRRWYHTWQIFGSSSLKNPNVRPFMGIFDVIHQKFNLEQGTYVLPYKYVYLIGNVKVNIPNMDPL